MSKPIRTFLSGLAKKPADYQLTANDWSQIIFLYQQGTEENQDYLVQGLSQQIFVTATEIHECIITSATIDVINQKQADAQNEVLNNFSARCQRIFPQIGQINLNRSEWLELARRFNRQGISRITSAFLFTHLAVIKHCDYSDLVNQTDTRPSRTAKRAALPKDPPTTKRRKYRETFDDNTPNTLIISDESDPKLHSPLKEKGVRVTTLTPATPEKEYSHVCRTPGKHKVRKIFSHEVNGSVTSFFKPKTPSPQKIEVKGNEKHIRKKMPKLVFVRHEEPIYFQATLEKLEQRKSSHRRVGQNQLTGASCQSVFAACNENIVVTSRGSKYHWSHLIAFFLGGEQSIENLVPATAASNYNILEAVEQFIAKKLTENNVDFIEIKVEPTYVDRTNIPGQLVFTLDWQEAGKNHTEIMYINPRSHERITRPMLKTFDFIRTVSFAEDEEPEDDMNITRASSPYIF
ncbi:DNA/RNA non-specific endonuclease [Legionella cardiaca]|uniref:DNA/RNA non-specific endonuclease n=1 Tax=Legionella cardiaca TaxID=1071983 RepID=A0ABY8AS37_9GAMM|nr:DNA/RNA non-specific endonuclease [Legionella cardiaca]WED42579.1 DNA/RNA non-specific endonuclease [Legionella cardiaca]